MSRGLELEKAKRWSDAKAESGRGALGKDGHGPSRLRVNSCPYWMSVLSLGNACRIVRRVKPSSSGLKLCSKTRRVLQRKN